MCTYRRWQSVALLASFVLQRKSWTKKRIDKDGKLVNRGKLVEDEIVNGAIRERKFHFVKLKKTVSVLCKWHDSRNLWWPSCKNRRSFKHFLEWSCARQKLDKTEIVNERAPEVGPGRFHVFVCGNWSSWTHWRLSRLYDGCIAWGDRQIYIMTNTKSDQNDHWEILDGSSKDECAQRQDRWDRASEREEKEFELSEAQGMCLWKPWNRDDEQMAVRHADASGGDIIQSQHEENRMRDIHVGKRRSEAAIWQFKEDITIWARISECISVFRPTSCSEISCEWCDAKSAGVRICAEVRSWRWRRTHFCVGSVLRDGWKKESLQWRHVGLVSRRRWWRFQEKWMK